MPFTNHGRAVLERISAREVKQMNRRVELSIQADGIANAFKYLPYMKWAALRDAIDTRTGGEMDAQPLDILTDMVAARLLKMEDKQMPFTNHGRAVLEKSGQQFVDRMNGRYYASRAGNGGAVLHTRDFEFKESFERFDEAVTRTDELNRK